MNIRISLQNKAIDYRFNHLLCTMHAHIVPRQYLSEINAFFHAPTNSSSHICCMTGRPNEQRRLYCTFLNVWCVAKESLILAHVPSPLPEGLTNNHKALHALVETDASERVARAKGLRGNVEAAYGDTEHRHVGDDYDIGSSGGTYCSSI